MMWKIYMWWMAAFFPSASAVNPALTIAANALRVGDKIKERLGIKEETKHAMA